MQPTQASDTPRVYRLNRRPDRDKPVEWVRVGQLYPARARAAGAQGFLSMLYHPRASRFSELTSQSIPNSYLLPTIVTQTPRMPC